MLSNDEPLSTPLLDDEISPQLNIAEPYSHSACTRLTRHHHNQLSSDFSQVRDCLFRLRRADAAIARNALCCMVSTTTRTERERETDRERERERVCVCVFRFYLLLL